MIDGNEFYHDATDHTDHEGATSCILDRYSDEDQANIEGRINVVQKTKP